MTNIDNLPIDINSNKLSDWLISRRHCERTWFDHLQNIKIKLNEAIKQLPDNDDIKKIVSLKPLTYYQCLEILDVLKETEKDTKNMLGYYSSPIYKTFSSIISAYEKNNVYLGEASQVLQRLVQFELPHIKKTISKVENDIESFSKKYIMYGKMANDKKKLYEKELAKMGLKGENLKNELLKLTLELPDFLSLVTEEISQLKGVVTYFKDFTKYTVGEQNILSLPLITLILEKGINVTAYEYKNGKAPTQIEKPNIDIKFEAEVNDEDEINFDIDDDIYLGDDDCEIDFGSDIQIEVVGDNEGIIEDGIARGDDALPILENPITNRLILSELKALSLFLKFRSFDQCYETSADMFIDGFANDGILKQFSTKELTSYLEIIDSLFLKLTDEQKIHLFKIKSSPHYVNIIIEDLISKRDMEGKMLRHQKNMEHLIENSKKILLETKIEGESIKNVIKYLKTKIEESISKKYSNRPVNIMGEINMILN
uniref:CDK5RAP3-like protein n=1 Tax=Parastrongyloides trichosuri TaxID=131310 RepID=A0A0N4Z0P2_PARTI